MTRHLLPATALACAVMAQVAHADQPVAINFAAELGGAPFACGQTYPGQGQTHATVQGADYRIFVSDAALVSADGALVPVTLEQDGKWQTGSVALLDFEDGTGACAGSGNADTNTSLRGTAPEGDYVGLSFTVGLPFDLNHADPTLAASPLNTTALFWNWQNGYRFVRIDLVPEAEPAPMGGMTHGTAPEGAGHGAADDADHGGHDAAPGWFLHLGSTVCAADSRTEAPSACANPNLMRVTLTGFDPAKSVVIVDPAAVLADADLTVNAADTSPGCMSFPGDADCDTVMPRLGLGYGDRAAEDQLLFSLR